MRRGAAGVEGMPLHSCVCPPCFTETMRNGAKECVPKCDLVDCHEATGVCTGGGGGGSGGAPVLALLIFSPFAGSMTVEGTGASDALAHGIFWALPFSARVLAASMQEHPAAEGSALGQWVQRRAACLAALACTCLKAHHPEAQHRPPMLLLVELTAAVHACPLLPKALPLTVRTLAWGTCRAAHLGGRAHRVRLPERGGRGRVPGVPAAPAQRDAPGDPRHHGAVHAAGEPGAWHALRMHVPSVLGSLRPRRLARCPVCFHWPFSASALKAAGTDGTSLLPCCACATSLGFTVLDEMTETRWQG
jgi:hypothetical protein